MDLSTITTFGNILCKSLSNLILNSCFTALMNHVASLSCIKAVIITGVKTIPLYKYPTESPLQTQFLSLCFCLLLFFSFLAIPGDS